jgi:hypothetical protein
MDGVLHGSQVDVEYCWRLIKEYSILDSAQIFAVMKKSEKLTKRKRHYIGKSLTARGLAIRITHNDRRYFAKGPGLSPTGKHFAQIVCFWVLIDYITKVDRHNATGTFIRISMEIDGRDYGIVYVEKGQEKLCNANMRTGGDVRYFVVVEDTAQIPHIKGDNIHIFAAVSDEGKVEYYSMERGKKDGR